MPVRLTDAIFGPPKVGGDTLAYCTRCKMELAHVIVSMVEGGPSKVLCKTCKSQHKFKRVSSESIPQVAKKSAHPKTIVNVEALWEQRINAVVDKHSKAYSPKSTYRPNELIEHSIFGLGVVQETRGTGKMVVLFRNGVKILVQGSSEI